MARMFNSIIIHTTIQTSRHRESATSTPPKPIQLGAMV